MVHNTLKRKQWSTTQRKQWSTTHRKQWSTTQRKQWSTTPKRENNGPQHRVDHCFLTLWTIVFSVLWNNVSSFTEKTMFSQHVSGPLFSCVVDQRKQWSTTLLKEKTMVSGIVDHCFLCVVEHCFPKS